MSDSENCLLCRALPADKKGSHIIPHFLLKKIENVDGSKLRDMELGFTLTATDSKVHFGRSVSPEKLESVLGKLEESDIDNNKHPMVCDHIFCSNCETRFSNLESIYSTGLSKSISGNNESGNSGVISILFWISVFWRISILYPNIFSKKNTEFMRKYLDRYLCDSSNSINEKQIIEDGVFNKLGLRILSSSVGLEDPSHFMIHPKFKYPYSMIIYDKVITLSFNSNFSIFGNNNFFGLNKEILSSKPTTPIGKEILNPLDPSILKSMIFEVTKTVANQRIETYNSMLDEIHRRIGGVGSKMPDELKHKIWVKMANSEEEKSKQFTLDDFTKSIYEVLSEYIIR